MGTLILLDKWVQAFTALSVVPPTCIHRLSASYPHREAQGCCEGPLGSYWVYNHHFVPQGQTLLNTPSSPLCQGHTQLHLGSDCCSEDLANSSFHSTLLPGTRLKSLPGTKGSFFLLQQVPDYLLNINLGISPVPINPSQSPKSLLTQLVKSSGSSMDRVPTSSTQVLPNASSIRMPQGHQQPPNLPWLPCQAGYKVRPISFTLQQKSTL